jgi:hypothetical protein
LVWQLAYRYDGKQKTLALGAYPSITLSEARRKREDAKKAMGAGVDPSHQKRLERIAKSAWS